MFDQLTLWDTPNATSLPGSEDGVMHSDSQAGRTIGPCGPDHALASLSALQAQEREPQINDIFGRSGSISSESADQPSFLESKSPRRRSLVTKEKDREYQRIYRRKNRAKDLIRHAKFRALKKGIAFDLDDHCADVQSRIDSGVCEVTGMPFNLDGGRTWDSPSLDRVDPDSGYLYSNIRVVCHAVNSALGDWGETTLLKISQAILTRRRAASNELSERIGQNLMRNLEASGSPLYTLTWKRLVTESGHVIYRLRASARRTSANESTLSGWPTPNAAPGGSSMEPLDKWLARKEAMAEKGINLHEPLHITAQKSGWPTPRAEDSESTGAHRGVPDALTSAARLTGWTTPSARDWKDSPGMATEATNPDGTSRTRPDQLPRMATLAGWPTPVANDDNKSPEAHLAMKERMGGGRTQITSLQVMAKYTGPARITADGELLTGSSAGMESGGQLSPHMSRWLMGYPIAWCYAAMAAIPTKRRK